MSYWCDVCGTILEESDLEFRKSELEDSTYPWMLIAKCPYCGNEALEDAEKCEICGDPIRPGEHYCQTCEDNMYHIIDNAICEVGGDYIEAKEKLFEYLERRWL